MNNHHRRGPIHSPVTIEQSEMLSTFPRRVSSPNHDRFSRSSCVRTLSASAKWLACYVAPGTRGVWHFYEQTEGSSRLATSSYRPQRELGSVVVHAGTSAKSLRGAIRGLSKKLCSRTILERGQEREAAARVMTKMTSEGRFYAAAIELK